MAAEIMVSIESNGVLRAEGMEPGTDCTIEWASLLDDGFTNNPAPFEGLAADSNGVVEIALPMFFRVQGTAAVSIPDGMVEIPAGINSGTDPDFGAYALTNESAFYMDATEATNDEIVEVMQWAYDNGKITVSASTVQNAAGDTQELLDLDSSYCRITWDGSSFGMESLKGSGYPCVEITWYGSAAYCNYRSEMEGKTPCYDLSDWSCALDAGGYRLPTSDEWEYAARGGLSGNRFPWGDTITHDEANYYSSSSYSYDTSSTRGYHPDYDSDGDPYTSPGGDFAPNGYGLYDMAGNVWEWCTDWHPDYVGSLRVARGGSWYDYAYDARCGFVGRDYPVYSYDGVGFRSVLPAE